MIANNDSRTRRPSPNMSMEDSVEASSTGEERTFEDREATTGSIKYAIPVDDPEDDGAVAQEAALITKPGFVERHPRKCLLFWLLVYPVIFVSMIAFGGAWPLQLGPIQALTKSSVLAYKDFTAMTDVATMIKQGNPIDAQPLDASIQRRLQSVARATIEVFYEAKNLDQVNGVFSFIEAIKEFERSLVNEKYCPPPSDEEMAIYSSAGISPGKCSSMYPLRDSPVNYFYPTVTGTLSNGVKSKRIYDGKSSSPARNATDVYQEWITTKNARFLPRSFADPKTGLSLTRSTFVVQSSSSSELKGYVTGELYQYLRSSGSNIPGVVVSWDNYDLLLQELGDAVIHDAILASAGVAVVFIIMFVLFDLSVPLAAAGIASLALALPMAYAFFTVCLGIKEIFSLSFLSLYILFGVGSDCCFIFVDEMNSATTAINGHSKKHAWWRAVKATFVTMSTTAVSFFANAASPINVVREWGLFMGLTTSFAWLTVATVFPCAILSFSGKSGLSRRAKVNVWFGRDVAGVIKKGRYVLVLLTLILAITSACVTFAASALSPANGVPQFFDPQSSNLGRVFVLTDEFDWVVNSESVGGDDSTQTSLQCDEPEFVLDSSKTECVPACPDPCFKLPWTIQLAKGTSVCPCLATPTMLADYASASVPWPRQSTRVLSQCSSCNPDAWIEFEFSSSGTDASFAALNASLKSFKPGDTYSGYTIITHSLVDNSTSSPSSSPPTSINGATKSPSSSTKSPVGTASPSRTASPTLPTSAKPTSKPTTQRPTTLSPTLKPATTASPTRRNTKTSAPVPGQPPIDVGPTTDEPTTSPETSVPSSTPTISPVTSEPSAAPITRSPTQLPSRLPTTSTPSGRPTTSSPSKNPTRRPTAKVTRGPSRSPFALPRCPSDCSGQGTCDTSTRTCDCNLGFSGEDCSEMESTGISDALAERIAVGYGIDSSGNFITSFDFFGSQNLLLGICAALCQANNETSTRTVSGSRCYSVPIQRLAQNLTAALGFTPEVDLEALAYRKVTQCGPADFAEFVMSRGETYPVPNKSQLAKLVANATQDLYARGQIARDADNRIRFVRIEIQTTMSSQQTSASNARVHYEAWLRFLAQFTNAAPQTDQSGLSSRVSSSLFSRTETELSTTSGFLSSWIITTVVAVVAVAAYTRSLAMAVFAGLTMSGVIMCVFGFFFIVLGWNFGLVEAVGLTIVVGLTVDYAAHITYSFITSKREKSSEKAAEAVGTVGLAIFSSGVTTIGACSLLFAATILPFQKFGAMVCATIIVCLIYAFAFLVPALMIFGTAPRDAMRFCQRKWSERHASNQQPPADE